MKNDSSVKANFNEAKSSTNSRRIRSEIYLSMRRLIQINSLRNLSLRRKVETVSTFSRRNFFKANQNALFAKHNVISKKYTFKISIKNYFHQWFRLVEINMKYFRDEFGTNSPRIRRWFRLVEISLKMVRQDTLARWLDKTLWRNDLTISLNDWTVWFYKLTFWMNDLTLWFNYLPFWMNGSTLAGLSLPKLIITIDHFPRFSCV